MKGLRIRAAKREDAQELLELYAPYVEKTAITFEVTVPSVEEFAGRILQTLQRYPYIVAEENHEILGYAYTGPFKERAAYDWAVETSIYVKMGRTRGGIGKMLYASLEETSRRQHILNMISLARHSLSPQKSRRSEPAAFFIQYNCIFQL